jgi:hypothetical protein
MAAAEEYRHIAEESFAWPARRRRRKRGRGFLKWRSPSHRLRRARTGPNGLAPASSSNDENAQPSNQPKFLAKAEL